MIVPVPSDCKDSCSFNNSCKAGKAKVVEREAHSVDVEGERPAVAEVVISAAETPDAEDSGTSAVAIPDVGDFPGEVDAEVAAADQKWFAWSNGFK